MAVVRKTITLSPAQAQWIQAQIAASRYTNESEYIRDLIRYEQEIDRELEAIRAALIAGEESGDPISFEVEAFERRMRSEHG